MKRLLSLPAIACAAFLAACSGPAELGQPLSEPGAAPYDPRLVGMWIEVAGDGAVDLVVIRAHENGFLLADYMLAGANGDDEEPGAAFMWVRRTAYATVVEGETYYSSRQVDALTVGKVVGEKPVLGGFGGGASHWSARHPKRGYWILRPTIDGEGRMTLSYLAVKDLQKHGYSGREIGCGTDCTFTRFDLPPEDLVELIRTAPPDSLFTEDFGTYVRITEMFPNSL